MSPASSTQAPQPADPSAEAPSKIKKWCSIIYLITLVNFVAFLIGTAALGGDAVNGKSEGGRYYVAIHGKLTEVSHAAFTYSRLHCYVVWTTFGLAIFCALLFGVGRKPEKKASRE
jgi:hypothetical protein